MLDPLGGNSESEHGGDVVLPDPKSMSLDETRGVRNEIADGVIGMIQQMLDADSPHPADSCEVCLR